MKELTVVFILLSTLFVAIYGNANVPEDFDPEAFLDSFAETLTFGGSQEVREQGWEKISCFHVLAKESISYDEAERLGLDPQQMLRDMLENEDCKLNSIWFLYSLSSGWLWRSCPRGNC